MKLSVDRKELADATKAAAKFLPRMSHLAALEHLHIEAHSNQLMVSATNLDAGRTVEVEADISEEGRILVPATFAQIAAKAQGKSISIEVTDKVSVSDGASHWKLDLGQIEDYPEFSRDTDGEAEIESWARIQAVATHASRSDRPALEGVRFGDGFAAATDNYRLAWTACDAPEALIPAYAIQNVDAVRTLRVGQKHAAAVLSDGLWWSRLIDAKFPDWQRLKSGLTPEVSAVVVSEVLTEALQRASIVAPEAGKKLKGRLITLEVGDGITVKAGDSYSETIEADTDGEIEASFNISYLVDALAPVEKATLRFTDAFKPLLVESGWWNALIMPVRSP